MIKPTLSDVQMALEEMASDRATYEQFLDKCPLMCFVVSLDRQTVYYRNPAQRKVLKRQGVDPMKPDAWHHLIYPDDRETVISTIRKNPGDYEMTFRITGRNETEYIWVKSTVWRLVDEDGKSTKVAGINRPLTVFVSDPESASLSVEMHE